MERHYTDRFQDSDLATAVAALIDMARDYDPQSPGGDEGIESRACIRRICALLDEANTPIGNLDSLVGAVRATLRYPADWVTPLLASVEARAPGLMLQLISETAVGERADFLRRVNILEWMLPTDRLDSLVIALSEYRSTHPVYLD